MTFYKVHDGIGNGPVIRIAEKTKGYFRVRGYNLHYGKAFFYKGIKAAIEKNRPCAVLLSAGIAQWHWVIAVGYREYVNGEKYIQIINGWRNSSNQFIKVGSRANVIIKDSNGYEKNGNDPIGTGYNIEISNGRAKQSYTYVMYGDLNGDGEINSADLLKMRQYLLGNNNLSGAFLISAYLNGDNEINSADLLRIRQHLLGSAPIGQ